MGRASSRQLDPLRRPQLVGDSRAARQARRAAGVFLEGDDPKCLEHADRKSAYVSVRRLIRGIARSQGATSSQLGNISRWASGLRREALGLPPLKEKRP